MELSNAVNFIVKTSRRRNMELSNFLGCLKVVPLLQIGTFDCGYRWFLISFHLNVIDGKLISLLIHADVNQLFMNLQSNSTFQNSHSPQYFSRSPYRCAFLIHSFQRTWRKVPLCATWSIKWYFFCAFSNNKYDQCFILVDRIKPRID